MLKPKPGQEIGTAPVVKKDKAGQQYQYEAEQKAAEDARKQRLLEAKVAVSGALSQDYLNAIRTNGLDLLAPPTPRNKVQDEPDDFLPRAQPSEVMNAAPVPPRSQTAVGGRRPPTSGMYMLYDPKNLLASIDHARSTRPGTAQPACMRNGTCGSSMGSHPTFNTVEHSVLKQRQRSAFGRAMAPPRPLRLDATGLSKQHLDGAERFDKLHVHLTGGAYRIVNAMRHEPTHRAKKIAFLQQVNEVAWNRYREPTQLSGVFTFAQRQRPVAARRLWRLEDSIWAPRTRWCDASAFYDTEECKRRMFECDWNRAERVSLRSYIERNDDGDDGKGTEDGEVTEVREELWSHCSLIYLLFDYYASQGSSSDIFSMQLNAYTQFLTDFQLANKHHRFCKKCASGAPFRHPLDSPCHHRHEHWQKGL